MVSIFNMQIYINDFFTSFIFTEELNDIARDKFSSIGSSFTNKIEDSYVTILIY